MEKAKPAPPKYGILPAECLNKERLLDVVGQLADQGKQMTITTAEFGWTVHYSTGPSQLKSE